MCSVTNFFKQLFFLFLRFKPHPMSKTLYNLQEESSSFTDQLESNKYSSVWYEWFFNIPAWSWYWILFTLPFTVETLWCKVWYPYILGSYGVCAIERFPGTLRLHHANFLLHFLFFQFDRKNKISWNLCSWGGGKKRPSNISLLCPDFQM
jgi:hypothetical protein